MFPTWSPDSRYVAYAAHLNSLFRAIYVADVESGQSRQVTDGLADAMYPVFDASGKYLWFLASTDFGLRSQWLDMTSYDHVENFGLYLAVLKKGDPSPLLPESDEESGIAAADHDGPMAAAGDGGGSAAKPASGGYGGTGTKTTRPPSPAVKVTIDFDGLRSRIVAVPGVPEKPYALLKAGATGNVYYIEIDSDRRRRSRRGTARHPDAVQDQRPQGHDLRDSKSPTMRSVPTARSSSTAPRRPRRRARRRAAAADDAAQPLPRRRRQGAARGRQGQARRVAVDVARP